MNKEPLISQNDSFYNNMNMNNKNYYYYCIKSLGYLFAAAASIICSYYIFFIYHDIHTMYISYLSIQNILLNIHINSTEIQLIRQKLEFITYCVTDKYCKRIH